MIHSKHSVIPPGSATGNTFIEYRMLLLLSGCAIGFLYGDLAFVVWGILFFFIGLAAEVIGKCALKVGLIFSSALLTKAIIGFFLGDEAWLCSLYMALISMVVSIDSIHRKRTVATS